MNYEEERKSKHLERQSQGYAPGDRASLLSQRWQQTHTFKRHSNRHARALAHSRREGEEEDRDEVGSISGKPMNSGRSCHCFSAFSDQEVFMCADQNHVEVI